jgi:hypothetical protein
MSWTVQYEESSWKEKCSFIVIKKGKTFPLQTWSGPEGSRKIRFPDFMTTAQDGGRIVSPTHWPPYPQEGSWYSFLLEAESYYFIICREQKAKIVGLSNMTDTCSYKLTNAIRVLNLTNVTLFSDEHGWCSFMLINCLLTVALNFQYGVFIELFHLSDISV